MHESAKYKIKTANYITYSRILLIALLNDKRTNIGIIGRHGHGAEDSVSFAPCYDADIIACILFESGTSVLSDHGTGRACFRGRGLVPVPCTVGICCEEDIVAVASVDDVPVDVHLQIGSGTRVFGRELGRRRGDVFHIGPGAEYTLAS